MPAGLVAVAPDRVATHAALRKAGVSASMIAARCRPDGPWRRLLPGVVLLSKAPPTRRQLLRAAVTIAGPDAVITGVDALQALGLELPTPRAVHLLVPAGRRLGPNGFLTVERSARLPVPVIRDGLPFAPAARAATDAARTASDSATLRSVLALTVERGLSTVEALRTELDAGNQRGTSAVRSVLGTMLGMVATMLHGRAHRVLRAAPLPAPRWNVTVCDRRRRPIGHADAWWDEVGLAWLIEDDSRAGGRPGSHVALAATGIIVVRTPASLLRDPHDIVGTARIIRELTSAFVAAARRPRPKVLAASPIVPITA